MSDANRRDAWQGYPNPYDAPAGDGDPATPFCSVEADALRRSAAAFERSGRPATATLFRNAAWIAENGVEWLAYIRADGGIDDADVTEVRR